MQTELAGLSVVLWAKQAKSEVIVTRPPFNNNPIGLFHK